MGLREDGSLGRGSVLLASASSPTGRQVSVSGRGARVVFALRPAHHIISWPARVPTALTDFWDGWRENLETRGEETQGRPKVSPEQADPKENKVMGQCLI